MYVILLIPKRYPLGVGFATSRQINIILAKLIIEFTGKNQLNDHTSSGAPEALLAEWAACLMSDLLMSQTLVGAYGGLSVS